MSAPQSPLVLVAAGVCTQAGDSAFAAHAAVQLKINGGKPDAVITVPAADDGSDQPLLSAPLGEEVLELECGPDERIAYLLQEALGALASELPESTLNKDARVHVLLPPTSSARGEDLDLEWLRETVTTLQPAYAACHWSFSRDGAAQRLTELAVEDWDLLILAGVDSLVDVATCFELAGAGRVMTAGAGQGLVPGEAAAAVALAREDTTLPVRARLRGWASGQESAVGQARSRRLSGLRSVMQEALATAGVEGKDLQTVSHNLGAELSGELEWFQVQQAFWPGLEVDQLPEQLRPYQAFGELGAAALPLQLALTAAEFDHRRTLSSFGFAQPGPALVCETPDGPTRGAICVTPA